MSYKLYTNTPIIKNKILGGIINIANNNNNLPKYFIDPPFLNLVQDLHSISS